MRDDSHFSGHHPRDHADTGHERRADSVLDADALPAELQALHRRLLADGASWRRGLSATDGIRERARQVARPVHSVSDARRTGAGSADSASGNLHGRRDDWQQKGTVMSAQRPLRNLAAATAAVAIVGLLALVFYAFAASRGGPAIGTHPGGATSRTVAHGVWQTNDALTFTVAQQVMSGSPAISPSDPNTDYEASLAPLKLRRTTDAGANWTDLKVPGDTSNLEDFQVFVSPLDGKSVFLTLTTPLAPSQASTCPTAAADVQMRADGSAGSTPLALTLPQSGKLPCSLQYHSSDGGATWQQLKLPVRASLADLTSDLVLPTTHILRAQGSRLYAAAGCGPLCMGPGDDIVTSTDGGATWTLADSALRAAGYYVCDFAPSPSGSDVFALTSKQGCQSESVSPLTLWHSGDAGTHWSQVGAPPTNLSFGMAVVAQSGGSPLLYIHMPQATPVPHTINMTNDASSLKVSADGGKTWTSAPIAGVASGLQPSSGPMAVLSDGTVVEAFSSTNTMSLLGWKLGEAAWHQVAPPLKGQVSQLLVIAQAGEDELLAVTNGAQQAQNGGQQGQNSITYTVQSYVP